MGNVRDDYGLATKVCLSAAGAWAVYSVSSYYKRRRAFGVEQAKTVGTMAGKRVVVTGKPSMACESRRLCEDGTHVRWLESIARARRIVARPPRDKKEEELIET